MSEDILDVRVTEYLTTPGAETDIFCVRFSDDGGHLAAGCGDGSLRVYSAINGKQVYNISTLSASKGFPMTCVRFRPITSATKTRNVVLTANSSGVVQHIHITSGKTIHSINEEPNQVFCVDYRKDAKYFATAGKDVSVRLYDEATKRQVSTMSGGRGLATAGHSNRVFSLKFHPSDPNLIITGGWDNTIQVWDIREDHSVRSIYGPHICGDAVDIVGDALLSGSWRPEKQIQLWGFTEGTLMQDVPVRTTGLSSDPNMIYGCVFNHDGSLIASCGSGANEGKIISRSTGEELYCIQGKENAFYSCHFSPDGTKAAFAGKGGRIHILEIETFE